MMAASTIWWSICEYSVVHKVASANGHVSIERYGVVPQCIYPESYNSSNSSAIDKLLTSKLREYALELRELHAKTITSIAQANVNKSRVEVEKIAVQIARRRKSEQMVEVYTMLSIALGKPPKPDAEVSQSCY